MGKWVLATAMILAAASAKPGGYTGYGGVYTGMAVEGEAMSGAKKAAKMAETQAIFEDESLVGALENRNVRKAVYIPTFFPNVAQQFSRDTQTYDQQIFYDQCRPANPHIY